MLTTPQMIARQLDSLGVALPDQAADALATLTALQEAANHNPTADAAAAILDGTVTAKNAAAHLKKHAQALTVAEKARAALGQLEQPCHTLFWGALRSSADDLAVALRVPFDQAATVVQEAGRHFRADATSDEVLAGGVEAVAAWERVAQASAVLNVLRTVRVQIAELTGHNEQDASWWIAEAEDAETLEQARFAYSQTGDAFHNLAHAGFTLRLNTMAEAQALVERAERNTWQRAQDAEQERLREHARTMARTA